MVAQQPKKLSFEQSLHLDPCLIYELLAAMLYGLLFLVLRHGLFDRLCPLYRHTPDSTKIDLISRLVSTVNAIIAVCSGYYLFFIDDQRASVDAFQAAFGFSPLRNLFLSLVSGYLMYDLALCLYYKSTLADTMTLIHHSVIIIAFTLGMHARIGTYFMATLLLNEVSTLFQNVNSFLACLPQFHSSALYRINAVMFLITFFLYRVMLNTLVLGRIATTWKHANETPSFWLRSPYGLRTLAYLLCALALGHVILNLYWFPQVVAATRRKLCRRRCTHQDEAKHQPMMFPSSSIPSQNNRLHPNRDVTPGSSPIPSEFVDNCRIERQLGFSGDAVQPRCGWM